MSKNSPQSELAHALAKIITDKDVPCKEKHVRATVLAALKDPSGVAFFICIEPHLTGYTFIRKWKVLFMVHMVFQKSTSNKNIMKCVKKILGVVERAKHMDPIYSLLCDQYNSLMIERYRYLSRFPFLQTNFDYVSNKKEVPFSTPQTGLEFIRQTDNLIKYYIQLLRFILDRVETVCLNPSADPVCQLRLRPAAPLLEDLENIYKILIFAMDKMIEFPCTAEVIESATHQSGCYHGYKEVLRRFSFIQFISNMYTIPRIRNTVRYTKYLEKNKANKTENEPSTPLSETAKSQKEGNSEELRSNKSVSGTDVLDSGVQNIVSTFPFDLLLDSGTSPPPPNRPIDFEALERIKLLEAQVQRYMDQMTLMGKNMETMKAHYETQRQNEEQNFNLKASQMAKINNELRKKVDLLTLSHQEETSMRNKFNSLTTIYLQLKQSYDSLITQQPPTNYMQQIKQTEEKMQQLITEKFNASQEVTRLKQELDVKETQLQVFEDKEKILDQKVAQLESLRERVLTEEDVRKNLLGMANHFLKLVCNKEESQLGLNERTLEILRMELKSLGELSSTLKEEPNNLLATQMFLTQLQATVVKTDEMCHQLADSRADSDLIEQLEKLSKAYYTTIKSIALSDQTNPFKLETLVQSYQDSLRVIESHVSEMKEEVVPPPHGDVESEINQTFQCVNLALEELNLLIENATTNRREADPSNNLISGCKNIFEYVKQLITDCSKLQREIVDKNGGKTTMAVKEFYRKNGQWSEGLTSASKAIGRSAMLTVKLAGEMAEGKGSLEQFIISLNNLAAYIAQLAATSKSRAERDSKNLENVIYSSKKIWEWVADTVADAREQLFSNSTAALDFVSLSNTQAKAMENESQVRILELEVALSKERERLGKIRAHNYRQKE